MSWEHTRSKGAPNGYAPLDGRMKVPLKYLPDIGSAETSITSHSALTGLTADDHSQYLHLTITRTVTATHIFNPASTGAPFTLGANATGQLVVGLNSDLLDGQEGSYYAAVSALGSYQLISQKNVASGYVGLGSSLLTLNTVPRADASGNLTDSAIVDNGSSPSYNGNILWHAGNDGTGSGLDADFLDGHDTGYFSKATPADNVFRVTGSVDAAKLLAFEVDGLTSGTTRTLTPPDANATVAGADYANAWETVQDFNGAFLRHRRTSSTTPPANIQIGETVISMSAAGYEWTGHI